jgi:hypothetical protein
MPEMISATARLSTMIDTDRGTIMLEEGGLSNVGSLKVLGLLSRT